MAKTEFGQDLSSASANSVYLLKTEDDTIVGVLSLEEGVDINKHVSNLQEYLYTITDVIGLVGEADPNAKIYATNNVITDGDNYKVALEKFDVQVKTNIDNILNNSNNIATNVIDIAAIITSIGAANGIAPLDGDSKVPLANMPNGVFAYKGNWDASTNTPTLIDGTGNSGEVYRVNVAGTQDLGSGSFDYAVGDKVVYNGTIWEKWDTTDEVLSVFGRTGPVVAETGDYTATQVGLGNVTDDAQLKRSAGDLNSFTQKNTLVPDDIVILEDSEDGFSKKKARVADMLGGGGGSGGINYISNSDFETNIDDWTVSAGPAIIISQETTSPLRGSGSLKINKSSVDASGQTIATSFTIDKADLAKILTIKLDYDFSDSNYNSGDARIKIVQDPLGTPVDILINGEDIPGGKNTYYARFQTDSSVLDYSLVIEWVSTSTDSVEAFIDSVVVGPQVIQKGAIVTDWENDTGFSIQNLGVSEELYKTRRVGGSIEVTGKVTFDGSGSGSVDLSLDSYSIDLDKVDLTAAFTSLGQAVFNDGGGNAFFARVNYDTEVDTVRFRLESTINAATTTLSKTTPTTIVTGDKLDFNFSVPIQGWSSEARMSSSYGSREISLTANNNGGEIVVANTSDITFSSKIKDTTASWNGSQYSVEETSDYDIDISMRMTVSNQSQLSMYINGVKAPAATSIPATASFVSTLSLVAYPLNRGDIVSFRVNSSRTLQADQDLHRLSIAKRSNPQTNLEVETIAARYTSNSGQSISTTGTTVVFEDLEVDTHGAYNASSGQYKTPKTGFYSVSATTRCVDAGTFSDIGIRVNGLNKVLKTRTGNFFSSDVYDEIFLNEGEIVTIFLDTQINTNLITSAPYNTFSIARIK